MGPTANRLALVYRGPASLPGCPEAVAAVIRGSRSDLDVRYVGPREQLQLNPSVLADAVLYAQPGGGELGRAFRRLRRHTATIQDFVRSGGRYLGFCLGAYVAGRTPGFDLLPGDTDQYIVSPGAETTTAEETVVDVQWGRHVRSLYFEDGPYIAVDEGPSAEVLARYGNGLPAAVVAAYGRGAVGVVGPHPEATPDWFTDAGLVPPRPLGLDLGIELVDRVLAWGRAGRPTEGLE